MAVAKRQGGRRQWHPTPVLLPGKSHGWRSLVGCSPWGCTESDTTEVTWQQQKTRKGKACKYRTKEGPRTRVRTSGRTNSASGQPNLHRQAQGEEKKTYKKRSQRAGGLSPMRRGTLLFVSLGRHALTPRGWIFLLFSKLNRAVAWSCNTDLSKSYNMVCLRPESYNMVCPRPESCDTPRALMYITPNLCSDEAEPRSIHLPDTWNKIIIQKSMETSQNRFLLFRLENVN